MGCRLFVVALLVSSSWGVAQGQELDPFDVSAATATIEEIGVPTVSYVSALEEEARRLFANGSCSPGAIEALVVFAKHANWLSNLISIGLEPFYDAPADDRRAFEGLNELVSLERLGNEYRMKRNIAMVMQAECYDASGDIARAVALYHRALELIDIDNVEWWMRARTGLYRIIEVGG